MTSGTMASEAATSGRTGGLPRFGPRSLAAVILATAVGIIGYGWPFLIRTDSALSNDSHSQDAPWIFAVLTVVVLAVVLAALLDGTADAKAIALLGVLAAIGAALRPLGPGVGGIEPMFVVFVLGGRVLGPAFGFALGATATFASALLTAGIGPWLPSQALAAAWIGLGAGLLPRHVGRRTELALLAGYAVLAGLFYGAVTNLWFWPFGGGIGSTVAFVPGGGFARNLHHYWHFYFTTSLAWDAQRGIVNAVLVLVAGGRIVNALRRSVARAAFDRPYHFIRKAPADSGDLGR